jgi:hypothetical protein
MGNLLSVLFCCGFLYRLCGSLSGFEFAKISHPISFGRLFCLQEGLKERELCVFFRNNHFSTMFKVGGLLIVFSFSIYLVLKDSCSLFNFHR